MIYWSTTEVVGVNFGDKFITAARLKGGEGKPLVLTHSGWVPYDPSASETDIAAALKSLWRSAGFPLRSVCASLRSASIVMRYFRFPAMPKEELQSALILQAEEALQMARPSIVLDWHMDSPAMDGGVASKARSSWVEGILVAAPVKDVDRQLAILSRAGMDPAILDVRAMAVANLFGAVGPRKEESVCLVSLDPHCADVLVMSKAGQAYPRTVYCRSSTWEETPAFLVENVRDVLKHSEFKLEWEPVRRVVLTLLTPVHNGFVDKLREGLGLPVEIWSPLEGLEVKNAKLRQLLQSEPDKAAMLVPALGLALRGC